jgi:hypothetical protein
VSATPVARLPQASVLATVATACLLVASVLTICLDAQQRSAPQGESYASIAALPDWSGVWVRPFADFAAENARDSDPGNATGPPFTPAALAERAAARERILSNARDSGEPSARTTSCGAPSGMPHVMRFAFGIEFLFTPGRVTILLESGPMVRRIYTDGRPHDVESDPTYAGGSIGHWEGDTLVVDTVNLTSLAALAAGITGSGRTHITERIRRIDPTRLQIDTIVEDPVMLRTPWRYTRVYERSNAGHFERYCDNNRDGNDGEPDLTPPPAGVQ